MPFALLFIFRLSLTFLTTGGNVFHLILMEGYLNFLNMLFGREDAFSFSHKTRKMSGIVFSSIISLLSKEN